MAFEENDEIVGEIEIESELLTRFQTNEETIKFTPEKLFSIIKEANNGANFRQSKLAEEIYEKDPDIRSALGLRIAAIAGTPWTIKTRESLDEADPTARAMKKVLEGIPGNTFTGLLNFNQLRKALSFSIFTGFTCAWTNWLPGGNIGGWLYVQPYNFSFWQSRYMPRLRVQGNQFQGLPINRIHASKKILKDEKGSDGKRLLNMDMRQWIYHRHFLDFSDVARSGLIRPLAYMYAFNNLNIKDMMRFREKFGMPFILAQMANLFDEKSGTLSKEARAVKKLIQSMGSDAAGLFSKSMDVELAQAGNVEGNIFFKSDDKYKTEVSKLIVGQTSSQDSKNSNRSTANVHNLVRNDIREADVNALDDTFNQQIIPTLKNFLFGPAAPDLMIVSNTKAPADQKLVAETMKDLKAGGIRPTPKGVQQVSEDLGGVELEVDPTGGPANGPN